MSQNIGMTMSAAARARMRATERAVLRYYDDMGKGKGNCTWGIGFLAHRGICSAEELTRKVQASSIDIEYAKRIAEAERRVKLKVRIRLNQAQFDGIVSFTYNTTNLTNERVFQALNEGDFTTAADRMSEAVKVRVGDKWKTAPGLIKRRAEESAPFRASADAEQET